SCSLGSGRRVRSALSCAMLGLRMRRYGVVFRSALAWRAQAHFLPRGLLEFFAAPNDMVEA
ncbi:unnamed protein product, partial [Ectocarpus sp. 13 AM-2016]